MAGEKDLHMALLYDYYGDLLTEKQKDVIDLYYNEDLSLAEIAEHSGITRQGVHDSIRRAEQVMREFEDKLGLVRKSVRLSKIADELDNMLETGIVSAKKLEEVSAELRGLL